MKRNALLTALTPTVFALACVTADDSSSFHAPPARLECHATPTKLKLSSGSDAFYDLQARADGQHITAVETDSDLVFFIQDDGYRVRITAPPLGEHIIEITITNDDDASCTEWLQIGVVEPDTFSIQPPGLYFEWMAPGGAVPAIDYARLYTVSEEHELSYLLLREGQPLQSTASPFSWDTSSVDDGKHVRLELPRVGQIARGTFTFDPEQVITVERLDASVVDKEVFVYRNQLIGVLGSDSCLLSMALLTTHNGSWVRGLESDYTVVSGPCSPSGPLDDVSAVFSWDAEDRCVIRVEAIDFEEELTFEPSERANYCPD